MSDLDTGGPSAGGLAPDDFADQYSDFSVPDPFAVDLPAAPPSRKRPSGANAISSLGLGIGLDEEVVVAKKPRLTAPKFDESLLLDKDKGIPKLQERAKKLRLKGKGHEFSDCQRMLEMYQLWLNNLYPRARFLDAAGMVERLGHKSLVVMARKRWIDGRKFNGADPDLERLGDDALFDDPMLPPRDTSRLMQQDAAVFTNTREKAEAHRAERRARGQSTPQRDAPDDLDLDDLFGATPAKKSAPAPAANKSMFGGGDIPPSDDDLDALMAEQEMNSAPPLAKELSERIIQQRSAAAQSQSSSIFGAPSKVRPPQEHDDDFPEDDDLEALMAEADMNSQPNRGAPSGNTSIFGPPKSAPAPNNQDDEMDDLDALLAERDDNASAKKPKAKTAPAVEEEEADYDAMFEETEKLHDTLDAIVEKAKGKEEKENLGVDEDEMAAMGDVW